MVGVSVVRGRLLGAIAFGWPSSSQNCCARVPRQKPSSGIVGDDCSQPPDGVDDTMLPARSMMSKCTVSPRITPLRSSFAPSPADHAGIDHVVVGPGRLAGILAPDRRLAGAGRGDALAIGRADAEPHAVTRDIAGTLIERRLLADELAPRIVVGVGQQHLARHFHKIRIAVERVAVGEGELGALHQVWMKSALVDRRRPDRNP